MFMIFIYTAGILYLFYNFELIVKTMEKEMAELRKSKQRSANNMYRSNRYRRSGAT